MSSLTDIAEKHARILGELAEFGLNLARKLHDQAMAAEEPEVTADLAKAFHAVSRSLRQTLLLEARAVREAEDLAQQDHEEAEQEAEADLGNRRAQISNAISGLVDAKYADEDESQALYEEVVERLYEESAAPGFLDQPIDEQIERLCKAFGLPLPGHPVLRPPEPASAARDPEAPPAAVPLLGPDPHDWPNGPLNPASPQPP